MNRPAAPNTDARSIPATVDRGPARRRMAALLGAIGFTVATACTTPVPTTTAPPTAPSTAQPAVSAGTGSGSRELVFTDASTSAGAEEGRVISVSADLPEPSELASPMIPDARAGTSTASTMSIWWAKSGNRIFVTTFGSGSCPQVVARVWASGPKEATFDVVNTQLVAVPISSGGQRSTSTAPRSCTGDLRAYTMEIELPRSISPAEPVALWGLSGISSLPARDR